MAESKFVEDDYTVMCGIFRLNFYENFCNYESRLMLKKLKLQTQRKYSTYVIL